MAFSLAGVKYELARIVLPGLDKDFAKTRRVLKILRVFDKTPTFWYIEITSTLYFQLHRENSAPFLPSMAEAVTRFVPPFCVVERRRGSKSQM
ncbi:MAG TPA: hypothetical protein VI793_13740, partial [Anaerolineales bacterium]|nr:hypothetical protein [Anaerolineales bacterium]